MGVIVSYLNGNAPSNEPDAVTGLTPKEVALVEQSWSLVKKDLVGTGVNLFLIFFKSFPEYQKLFPFKDVPYDELATNPKLKGHATSVMYALCAIVDNLRNTDLLLDLLEKNAASHAKKGLTDKPYWDLKDTVMQLLEAGLGSKFNKDTKSAWDKTLTVAFTVITDSLKKHQAK